MDNYFTDSYSPAVVIQNLILYLKFVKNRLYLDFQSS